MPKVCEICGKGARMGSSIIRRGMAKKKGGIGLHSTGINKREFRANLHKVRAIQNGRKVRLVVCTSCIKSGKVIKA
ncbi:MAG: 50S ribosomal protein L28 [Kiritimatiellae bacterium]|nr:50S ribosomal protein L28 [Kiritimatiellia bacterium]MDD5521367.1 50S ribosomal protein L28 [Kiritimatiellia bacterium]